VVFQAAVDGLFPSTAAGVPSMFDSLEVKVLCPRSGGDEGLARRKGGDPQWIRGPHDARAVLRGARLYERHAVRVRTFIEKYVRLGPRAGPESRFGCSSGNGEI
jgi:hypothetical protein